MIVEIWLDSFQRSGLSVAFCLTHSLGCTIREKLDTSSELIQDLQLKLLFGVRRGLLEGKTVIVGIWLDSFQRSDFLPKLVSLSRICS